MLTLIFVAVFGVCMTIGIFGVREFAFRRHTDWGKEIPGDQKLVTGVFGFILGMFLFFLATTIIVAIVF